MGNIIERSTTQELMAIRSLKERIIAKIQGLKRQDYYISIIWDADHVLIEGRSDDIFEMLQDLDAYFNYEERLMNQPAYHGQWMDVAVRCGQLHDIQFVVTARSTYTSPRITNFLIKNRLPVAFHYSVGSQPKSGSYRAAIKETVKRAGSKKCFIFMVDDGEHHCKDFLAVAAEMNMADCVEAVWAPRIRKYTQDELSRHYEAVMDPTKTEPFIITEGKVPGVEGPRYSFLVTPDGKGAWSDMVDRFYESVRARAIIADCREELENIARTEFPDHVITDDFLIDIWRIRYGNP